ncbi:extracellular solute-binding protein [Nocardia mexicana]|nr:extracellular solute-binding protein [Nocardia mexicana]
MSARRKLLTGAIAALGVLTATTACSSTPADDNEILVYNAQYEPLTRQWVEAFTKETGIRVTLRNGDDIDLARQVVSEDAASPADVLLTENAPAMALVDRSGLFAELEPPTLAQVPEQYRPSSGRWIGTGAHATVFDYNIGKLPAEQLPASLLDLQQPQWKGRWTVPTSGADFQALVAGLLALRGEQDTAAWLRGMKENAVSSGIAVAAMRRVDIGQVDGGVIYHDDWYRDQAAARANSGNTALHYFRNQDPGAFVSISGAGVLKSSKKAAAAQRFVRFVTGRIGQEVLARGDSMAYPVGSGVPANPVLPPLDSLQAPRIDPSTLDAEQAIRLTTEAGLQ